jgi:hypothetical protein
MKNSLTENEFKGILEIKFPDNRDFKKHDVHPASDSIIIKSKLLSPLKLKNLFTKAVSEAIKNTDTSKISPEFLKGSCSSDFCDLPTLRLSSSNDDIIFLNPFGFQSQPTITISPKASTCYGLIEYCKSRDKKDGCMECANPYMILVKNIANEMVANTK